MRVLSVIPSPATGKITTEYTQKEMRETETFNYKKDRNEAMRNKAAVKHKENKQQDGTGEPMILLT